MRISEVLRAAKARIERFGWIQGRSQNAEGACCIVGAIMAETDTLDSPYLSEVLPMVRRNIGDVRVPTWNDTAGRTKEEVLSVLERSAAEAEANGQ